MNKLKGFLLFFPAINIFADSLFVFEPLRMPITYLRGVLLVLVLFTFIIVYGKKIWRLNEAFVLIFFYLSVLLFFSSDIEISIQKYIKYLSGIIMFPVFYLITSNLKDLIKVKRSFLIVLFLFVINFVFADLFNLGKGIYSDGQDNFNSGNLEGSSLYIGSLLLITAPLFYSFLKSYRSRIFYIILNISVVIILILSMRRTAIFIVLIAYFFITFFYRTKSSLYKYGIVILTLTAITVSFNFDKIQKRIELRSDRFEEGSLEKEGRYQETILIFSNIFSFEDNSYSFFGRELFNSAGNYGYPDPKRLIHADYNIIISGSGLIGLYLYFLFNYKILLSFIRIRSIKGKSSLYYLFWVTSIVLLITSIAASFSSGLFAITYRSTLYGLLGTFFAVLNKKIIPLKKIT